MATERNTTRTVIGVGLQTALSSGIPHKQPAYTTINEAVRLYDGYLTSMEPRDKDDPANNKFNPTRDTRNMTMKYLVLGRGAIINTTGADGEPYQQPWPHKTTDFGPYSFLPLAIIRPGEPDLSPTERAQYRMRRHITFNGEDCIFYFALLSPVQNAEVEYTQYTLVNGKPTNAGVFIPTETNLKPPRPTPTPDGTIPNDGTYYQASVGKTVVLSVQQLQRIVDAIVLITGSAAAAKISEWGFCSGVDRTVTTPTEGLEYTDVLGLQVDAWLVDDRSLATTTELTLQFRLGNAEPLFGIGNTQTPPPVGP